MTVKPPLAETTMLRAHSSGIAVRQLGFTGGDALTLQGERPILVAKLRERFEGWLPAYMAGAAA